MIHDVGLTDKLSEYGPVEYEGTVYRVTRRGADPAAPSTSGGRWAFSPNSEGGDIPVLYTSLDPDGAIAEVASYLMELYPLPTQGLELHKLSVTVTNTLRLKELDLKDLGVDMNLYGQRNYEVTQKIGAAVNFLGFAGLIAPSARWKCDNLIIFTNNHKLDEQLEISSTEEFDWQEWARLKDWL